MTLSSVLKEYQELPEFQGVLLTSVDQQGGFRSTPLHVAIYRGFADEVRILLEANANPNAVGEYGETPLQVALGCKDLGIVEQLLRAGAGCDLKDEKGMNSWDVSRMMSLERALEEVVRRVSPPQMPYCQDT
jgi:ankyrin repeat protein